MNPQEKPMMISQIEALWGGDFQLHLAPSHPSLLGGLMAYKKDKPKYALDDTGQVVGLNLCATGLDDEKWHAIETILGERVTDLKALNLNENQLVNIKLHQGYSSLEHLDLGDNQIKVLDLPKAINQLKSIELIGNPTTTPSPEIVNQGSDAILNWLAANRKDFKEIKVLLVGDPKVGKTSVLKRLKDNTFSESEPQTDGIIIEDFDFGKLPTFSEQSSLKDTKAYFWDFGGQQILNATHEFFMTSRSVYMLLLEARKDVNPNDQVRQWMKRIRAFGGDSQVIVVANKIEVNPSFGISTYDLQRDYPQIKAFVKISCLTEEGLPALRDTLAEVIPKAELCTSSIDEKWIAIKDDLQKATDEDFHLSEDKFRDTCVHNKLENEKEQLQAIKFLNDLGILLHFDEFGMRDFFVLDPFWVTSGVYKIITSKEVARANGLIPLDRLRDIVNRPPDNPDQFIPQEQKVIIYTEREVEYLTKLMNRFKLGYITDGGKKLLIPSLLDTNTPVEEREAIEKETNALRFNYKYDYLPNSILPRLMVELQNHILHQWRTGIILVNEHSGAKALVTSGDEQIKIVVIGVYKEKRAFLSVIRYHLNELNKGLKVKPCIPLPGYADAPCVSYELLLKKEEKNENGVFEALINDELTEFPLSRLLDGIERKPAFGRLLEGIERIEGGVNSLHNKVDDIKEDIQIVKNWVDTNRYSQAEIVQMQNTLEHRIKEHFDLLPEAFKSKWQQYSEEAANAEDQVSGSFKLKIPIIPAIFEYETEINLNLKQLGDDIRNPVKLFKEMWAQLKRGEVFTYED